MTDHTDLNERAARAMGWVLVTTKKGKAWARGIPLGSVPALPVDRWKPATNIAHAMELVEKLNATQVDGHVGPTLLHMLRQCGPGNGWECGFCSDFSYTPVGKAPTAAEAITRAAIAAFEETT